MCLGKNTLHAFLYELFGGKIILMMCSRIMDYYAMLNVFPIKPFAMVSLSLLSLRLVAYGRVYTVSNQSSKANSKTISKCKSKAVFTENIEELES